MFKIYDYNNYGDFFFLICVVQPEKNEIDRNKSMNSIGVFDN